MTDNFEKLSARHYKEYTTCQLPGCDLPLERTQGQKVRKYCSFEHAKKAQMMYKKIYERLHADQVRVWKKRYYEKRKHLKQPDENQEPKTYQL